MNMGLYNSLLPTCPFTGTDVSLAPDPSPGLDGISYEATFAGDRFPIRLSRRDAWAKDSWVRATGPQFISLLEADGKLRSYFNNARSLDDIKAEYARLIS
jgi:hypothetical protein